MVRDHRENVFFFDIDKDQSPFALMLARKPLHKEIYHIFRLRRLGNFLGANTLSQIFATRSDV
jgi:hypothetical protein